MTDRHSQNPSGRGTIMPCGNALCAQNRLTQADEFLPSGCEGDNKDGSAGDGGGDFQIGKMAEWAKRRSAHFLEICAEGAQTDFRQRFYL